MSAECFCAYDQPAFYSARTVTAGKQHKCSECFRAIQPGERYEYAVGKWDGHFDSGMCPNCVTPWKCNGPHELTPTAEVSRLPG